MVATRAGRVAADNESGTGWSLARRDSSRAMLGAYGAKVLVWVSALAVAILAVGGCTEIRIPDPAVRYVAFGDSSTAGPADRDYDDILAGLLGEPPGSFANEGKGGEPTEEGLIRLEALLSSGMYPNAEVLLYWEGGNDVTDFIAENDRFLMLSPDDPDYPFADELALWLDEVQARVESAITMAQEAGLEVYVATYYPLRERLGECEALPLDIILPGQARSANVYVVRLNERLRAAADDPGVILVDVAGAADHLQSDPSNYFDCNHLSEQGNAIVAELFLDTLVTSAN